MRYLQLFVSICVSMAFQCAYRTEEDGGHPTFEDATCFVYGAWCSRWLIHNPPEASDLPLGLSKWIFNETETGMFASIDIGRFGFGLDPHSLCVLFDSTCCHGRLRDSSKQGRPLYKYSAVPVAFTGTQPPPAPVPAPPVLKTSAPSIPNVNLSSMCQSCLIHSNCGAERCMWNAHEIQCTRYGAKAASGSQDKVFVIDSEICEATWDWDQLHSIQFQGATVTSDCQDEDPTCDEFNLTATVEDKVILQATSKHARALIQVSHNALGTPQSYESYGTANVDIEVSSQVASISPTFEILVNVTSASGKAFRLYKYHARTIAPPISSSKTSDGVNPEADHPSIWIVLVIAMCCTAIAVPILLYQLWWKKREKKLRPLLEDDCCNSNLSSEWLIKSENVKIGREIGSGASAQVFEGTYCGELVAVKRLYSSEVILDQFQEFFDTEAAILTTLHHPNVVRFFGAVSGKNRLYVLTEFCQHTLASVVKSVDYHTTDFYRFAIGISNGVAYLHSRNTIHRDLKPENVLIHEGVVKICDFGMSRVVQQDRTMLSTNGAVGTPAFLAPELASGSESYASYKVDVYSFGVLLHYLWTRTVPYASLRVNPFQLMELVRSGLRPEIPVDMPDHLQGLMCRCWAAHPEERPTFDEISWQLEEMAGSTTRRYTISKRLSV